jgi:hypothetical protein
VFKTLENTTEFLKEQKHFRLDQFPSKGKLSKIIQQKVSGNVVLDKPK